MIQLRGVCCGVHFLPFTFLIYLHNEIFQLVQMPSFRQIRKKDRELFLHVTIMHEVVTVLRMDTIYFSLHSDL